MTDSHNSKTDFAPGGLALVIGAHGGIGQAMLTRLRQEENFCQVIGLSRNNSPSLDLCDESSVAAAARQVAEIGASLRLVFDATGFLHDGDFTPEKSWRQIDPHHMAQAFAINAIGPALLMKHFLPLLATEGKAVFATLSARVGSIGDNRLGGWYSYRASKAALNQLVRTAAIELGRTHPQSICVALHPGTVATSLSEPFSKKGLEIRSPETAADELWSVIDQLSDGDSGGFIDHHAKPVTW